MGRDGADRTIMVMANSTWNLANFRAPVIAGLRAAGYRVVAVAPADAAVERLGVPFIPLAMRSDGLNPLEDAGTILRIVRLLRRERPAVLLTWTPKPNIYGAIAGRLSGVPVVSNVSGLGTAFIRGGLLKAAISRLYSTAFRKLPAVFFQNRDDSTAFLRGKLVRAEQVRLLPGSGVDLKRFSPPAGPPSGSGCRFLFVGRLLGDKGVRELAAAARIVRRSHQEVRFTILGPLGAANRTAIGREELEGWVAEGLLEWAGTTDDVRPFLAEADAVVLPSYREGLPRSLLEAAAMGRPLIATDVPGNRAIVRDGENGLLCEVRSAESLASALTRFIALSNEEWRRMGEAGRRIVEREYGEERVVAAYLDVIRSIVA